MSRPLVAVPHPAGQPEDGPKRTVERIVVKVLVHRRDDRGLILEPYASRCVRVGEVHELVSTDHRDTRPGTGIDRVAFLGFPNHHNVLIAADDTLTGSELGLLPETAVRFVPPERPADQDDETPVADPRRSR